MPLLQLSMAITLHCAHFQVCALSCTTAVHCMLTTGSVHSMHLQEKAVAPQCTRCTCTAPYAQVQECTATGGTAEAAKFCWHNHSFNI